MMRVLVTGGAGFIGSHLVDLFLSKGAQVLVVDDLSTGSRENLEGATREFPKAVQLCELDICGSEARARMKAFKPDLICHLAAQMSVRRSVQEPQFDAEKNVVGTINLLEAARESGCRAFLFSSTGGAIYGEQEYFPADEKHPILPECPYGISKRSGELYLDYYARVYAMQTRALRLANVYGPRQNPKGEAGVVAIFSKRIITSEPLIINGDGEQTRDFVNVSDVVESFSLAAEDAFKRRESKGNYSTYNVGTARETSVNHLVSVMKQGWSKIGGTSFPDVEHREAMPGEQRRSVIGYDKIASELRWNPKVALVDGLAATISSFRR